MSESAFFILFGVTWVMAAAYALTAFRLLVRVRGLKAGGRAKEAPDPLTNPLDVFPYLGWLMTGRYADLNDEIAARWSGVARILFIVAAPMVLAVFVLAFANMGAWSQPT